VAYVATNRRQEEKGVVVVAAAARASLCRPIATSEAPGRGGWQAIIASLLFYYYEITFSDSENN
jgi:hypothetical protein